MASGEIAKLLTFTTELLSYRNNKKENVNDLSISSNVQWY